MDPIIFYGFHGWLHHAISAYPNAYKQIKSAFNRASSGEEWKHAFYKDPDMVRILESASSRSSFSTILSRYISAGTTFQERQALRSLARRRMDGFSDGSTRRAINFIGYKIKGPMIGYSYHGLQGITNGKFHVHDKVERRKKVALKISKKHPKRMKLLKDDAKILGLDIGFYDIKPIDIEGVNKCTFEVYNARINKLSDLEFVLYAPPHSGKSTLNDLYQLADTDELFFQEWTGQQNVITNRADVIGKARSGLAVVPSPSTFEERLLKRGLTPQAGWYEDIIQELKNAENVRVIFSDSFISDLISFEGPRPKAIE